MAISRPRHSAQDLEWLPSDAWVLAAVRMSGTAQRPGTLFDLVCVCDAVHHLIASLPEIEHAMSLLLGAELVIDDAPGFAVTPQGRALVAAAGRAAMGKAAMSESGAADMAHVRAQELLELLRTLPARPVAWRLDQREYEAACLEYRHTVWSEFRRANRDR